MPAHSERSRVRLGEASGGKYINPALLQKRFAKRNNSDFAKGRGTPSGVPRSLLRGFLLFVQKELRASFDKLEDEFSCKQ